MPNPNSERQPTPGVLEDPSVDGPAGLQVEQKFAHDTLVAAMARLDGVMPEETMAVMQETADLLMAGGEQAAMSDGADAFETELYFITPALGALDLSSLNAVLTSMDYINARLRTGATLPALPADDTKPPPGGPGAIHPHQTTAQADKKG